MFEFTIRENALLNEFKDMFADYVNKAYKYYDIFHKSKVDVCDTHFDDVCYCHRAIPY